MSDFSNPYAVAPEQTRPLPKDLAFRREGKIVVVTSGQTLPCRCVLCNEPAVEPIKVKKIQWHPQMVTLLVIFNVILYVIVARITRKTGSVGIGLCDFHTRRRRRGGWILVGGFLSLLLSAIVGIATDTPEWAIFGIVLLLVGLVTGLVLMRTVTPEKIQGDQIRLKGFGPAFLDSLAEN